MGIDAVYQIGAVAFFNGTTETTVIGGITRSSLSMNPTTTREVTAGQVDPTQSFLKNLKPMASFTTKRVDQVLSLMGTSGFCWVAPEALRLYLVKRQCAGPTAGSTHLRWKLIQGVIVPQSLTAAHAADAEISCQIYGITDSANNSPAILESGVALPTLAADTVRYTMNKVRVAATTLLAKTEMSIDFGIGVSEQGTDGELFSTFAGIFSRMPSARVMGLEPAWSGTPVSTSGTAITHANTDLFLKSRGFAVGTANHIKFSMAGTAYVTQPFDGSSTEPTKTGILLEGIHDGTTVPCLGQTAVVIP